MKTSARRSTHRIGRWVRGKQIELFNVTACLYEGADTGFRVVFLPQPVPEPSRSLALLVGASCTLIVARRKA